VDARRLKRTSFIHYWFVLDLSSSSGESNHKAYSASRLILIEWKSTYFSVLNVSLAYLSPGAKLQINIPTELPPSASVEPRHQRYALRCFIYVYLPCRIRVSLESRYGILPFPLFRASTTFPSVAKERLIAEDCDVKRKFQHG
jgi:hypothetical protein